jgi:hypothetical protein
MRVDRDQVTGTESRCPPPRVALELDAPLFAELVESIIHSVVKQVLALGLADLLAFVQKAGQAGGELSLEVQEARVAGQQGRVALKLGVEAANVHGEAAEAFVELGDVGIEVGGGSIGGPKGLTGVDVITCRWEGWVAHRWPEVWGVIVGQSALPERVLSRRGMGRAAP